MASSETKEEARTASDPEAKDPKIVADLKKRHSFIK